MADDRLAHKCRHCGNYIERVSNDRTSWWRHISTADVYCVSTRAEPMGA